MQKLLDHLFLPQYLFLDVNMKRLLGIRDLFSRLRPRWRFCRLLQSAVSFVLLVIGKIRLTDFDNKPINVAIVFNVQCNPIGSLCLKKRWVPSERKNGNEKYGNETWTIFYYILKTFREGKGPPGPKNNPTSEETFGYSIELRALTEEIMIKSYNRALEKKDNLLLLFKA